MEQALERLDLSTIINEMFLGYIERKNSKTLYMKNNDLPKNLIGLYYNLNEKDRHLDDLKENFVSHYISCETILEDTREKFESEGLRVMYDYIHSDEINYRFDIYTLLELHRKLYSTAPYPEVGGVIRNSTAYLDGAAVDLTPHENIRFELKESEYLLQEIMELGKQVPNNSELLFSYIEKCVLLKCKLIKIHPFVDGNGRSVRGFINKLFLNVGLPSIYICANETKQYKKAMNQGIMDGDYSHIIDFYYYKICDSIFELDIKPKVYGEVPFGKRMLEFVNNYKENLESDEVTYQEWDNSISYAMEKELTYEGINCELHSTGQFNENALNHNFLVVYFNDKGINKRLLIDPVFKKLYDEGIVEINIDNSSMKVTFDNLINNGITSVTHMHLSQYSYFFKSYADVYGESNELVLKYKK
ncbi:MAG: Fic family protein [Bacilli bacterium]|nr:Fic family protein [Bacilli bacterium]